MSSPNAEKSCLNCKNRYKNIDESPCKECKPGIRDRWVKGKGLYKPALTIGVEEE